MLRSFRIPYRLTFPSILFLSLIFSPLLAISQSDAGAAVTFTLDFPNSQPEHYSIRVQSDGAGRYLSSTRLSAGSAETDPHDPDSHDADVHDAGSGNNDSHNTDSRVTDSRDNDRFDLTFTVAASTRQKIFDLAAKAGYFQKDLDSHHKGIAFTGKKTLGYKDAQRSGEATFNYSSSAAVQELTSLMQGLGSTLEFGRRLHYDLRYQKLALDEELKRMEEMSHSHQLVEVAAIEPVLDQIIADSSVINVTRARAQRLLQAGGAH
jgi:hypothetical protein